MREVIYVATKGDIVIETKIYKQMLDLKSQGFSIKTKLAKIKSL